MTTPQQQNFDPAAIAATSGDAFKQQLDSLLNVNPAQTRANMAEIVQELKSKVSTLTAQLEQAQKDKLYATMLIKKLREELDAVEATVASFKEPDNSAAPPSQPTPPQTTPSALPPTQTSLSLSTQDPPPSSQPPQTENQG